MECTQRLEYTQELYEPRNERVCPEQIGFLGICGEKYPVKKGPNKIGRDPTTCSIVLNLNSVSRQHAVINVLNHHEFMLMDLDSANKTKLMNNTLQPYIPHPLKNGDLVQFGDIFGVFRLLEEDNDLPMTQALDIPDTPIATRPLSKVTRVPITTIPESPDVSDRDDSFIAPSQPKNEKCFKSSNSHFIKPSSHTISIQPVGSNKIDNIYWHSSKKSLSLNSHLDESNSELNKSNASDKSNTHHKDIDIHDIKTQAISDVSIHNMETQDPFLEAKPSVESRKKCSIYDMETQAPFPSEPSSNSKHNNNSIYDVETQAAFVTNKSFDENKESIFDMPTQVLAGDHNESVDSIYTADTQIPSGSPSIHSLPTQLPQKKEGLPEVRKIVSQHNMQLDLFTSNKNKEDIYEAETQIVPVKNVTKSNTSIENTNKVSEELNKMNKSDEEIILDDIYTQNFEDNFDSQPLLPPLDIEKENNDINMKLVSKCETPTKDNKQPANKGKNKGIETIVESDDSTDCEDIAMLPTQKITHKQDDDDLTDCEDLFDEIPKKTQEVNSNKLNKPNVDFEDMLTQVIDEDRCEKVDDKSISDLQTQVITTEEPLNNEINFEDLPTQVLDDDKIIMPSVTKRDANPMESPFKIPLVSPIKVKRKDIKIIVPKENPIDNEIIAVPDDVNYYSATQDIVNDLCSQKISSPDYSSLATKVSKEVKNQSDDDEFVPCSVEDYKTGPRFPHLESPEKFDQSFGSSECEERIGNFVSKLSSEQIRDVIGVENLKKIPSDLSESVESTPKKVRPIKFMDIDLPDSQEIRTGVSLHSKLHMTESSSDSEPDNDSEEQYTPILFKKKKTKKDAKIDLTKKFDIETLPTRVITRVRKPTAKRQNGDETAKSLTNTILKPKFLTEQEEDIDKDIIKENISRLKSKNDKNKNKDVGSKSPKHDNIKGKENEDKVLKVEVKPEVTLSKSSNNRKDKNETVRVAEKVKPNLDKRSNEKTKATESTKSEKSNKRESRRKKTKEVPSELKKLSSKVIEDCIYKAVDQSDTSTRSTRSTRAKRRENAKEIICFDDYSQEMKPRTRKEANKKPMEIDLTVETVPDIRRSKRQRTSKDKKEVNNEKPTIKSILKKEVKHEQSTVYNISSESGTDSPKAIKRSSSEFDLPSSKRTRSSATLNITTSRSTPVKMNQIHYVLFTAFPCEEVRVKLEKLGAVVVTDVTSCTVVLTMQIKRTFKLLCAVGLGKPIVGPDWVQACADNNMIVDPWLYLLKDEVAEKRFKFSLDQVLRSKRNFLKGFHVSSTPSVMPNATEMKLIVECSGGIWKEGGSQWICVSCTADKTLWSALKRKGAIVVATEFILGGVLRQRPDITANKL